MAETTDYHLRFPIGEFEKPQTITPAHLDEWINDLEQFPARLRAEVENLTDEELAWPYRPGGWNIRQVVHHCADSHINSITRFKLALTEDQPKIRPYFEDRWAQLPDTNEGPVEWSLSLLEGLHARLVHLLKSLDDAQLKRTFAHPEHGTIFSLDENIGIYAWHSNHHLAHVRQAKARHSA